MEISASLSDQLFDKNADHTKTSNLDDLSFYFDLFQIYKINRK